MGKCLTIFSWGTSLLLKAVSKSSRKQVFSISSFSWHIFFLSFFFTPSLKGSRRKKLPYHQYPGMACGKHCFTQQYSSCIYQYFYKHSFNDRLIGPFTSYTCFNQNEFFITSLKPKLKISSIF